MDKMQDEIRLCVSCGRELNSGPHRAIGICVWCVLEEQETKTEIKGQRYGRNGSDDPNLETGR
jgi:NMD protein affecting ribosome stability and mRNA decay